MSRFAVVYEDPEYEDYSNGAEQDIIDWLADKLEPSDTEEEQYSPFETINS
jgi:hypothetical protein